MNEQDPPDQNVETLSYPSPLFVPAYFPVPAPVPYLVSESGPLHKNV